MSKLIAFNGYLPSKVNPNDIKNFLLEEMGIGADVNVSNGSILIGVKTHHSAMKICTSLKGDYDFSIHHKKEYHNSFIVQIYDRS